MCENISRRSITLNILR